jgi:hypothetical protein
MTETIKECLERIAKNEIVKETDEVFIRNVLYNLGFNKAVIVCGIVYLEGHGTIKAPPTSIQQIAQSILRMIEQQSEVKK